jgi:hypothetical protein
MTTYHQKPYDWKALFLASLAEVPVVVHACKAAGVNRATAWRARETDPEFAKAWDEALEEGVDRAEQEAFRRAVVGYEKPVWYKGELVGTETVHSDALLALILRGRRKKVYAERTELTGADGGPVAQVDETAKAARVAQLLALAQRRKAEQDDFGDLA